MCVRTYGYDFNAPRRRIGRSSSSVAFPRDVQIAGDRGEKERRKRRVRNCAGIMAGAILWPMPRSRERVASGTLDADRAGGKFCNGSGTANSAIDEREVILFVPKVGTSLDIENSAAESLTFPQLRKFPELRERPKVGRVCKTEIFQVANISIFRRAPNE